MRAHPDPGPAYAVNRNSNATHKQYRNFCLRFVTPGPQTRPNRPRPETEAIWAIAAILAGRRKTAHLNKPTNPFTGYGTAAGNSAQFGLPAIAGTGSAGHSPARSSNRRARGHLDRFSIISPLTPRRTFSHQGGTTPQAAKCPLEETSTGNVEGGPAPATESPRTAP